MRQQLGYPRGPGRIQFHTAAGVRPNRMIRAPLERVDGFLKQASEGGRTPRPDDFESYLLFHFLVQHYHAVTTRLTVMAPDRALLAENGLRQFFQRVDRMIAGDLTADPEDKQGLRPSFFRRTFPQPFLIPLVRQDSARANPIPQFDIGKLILILRNVAGRAEGGANRISIPNSGLPAFPGRSAFRGDKKNRNRTSLTLANLVF